MMARAAGTSPNVTALSSPVRRRLARLLPRYLASALLLVTAGYAVGATLSGRVVHQSGQPARYVAIRLVPQHGDPTGLVYTGGDGSFYFDRVQAGRCALEVVIDNQVVTRLQIDVAEPATTGQTVVIP